MKRGDSPKSENIWSRVICIYKALLSERGILII